MDTLDADKGKKHVDAGWYHRTQERLAPYLRMPWVNVAPRTAVLDYKVEEVSKVGVKTVKE